MVDIVNLFKSVRGLSEIQAGADITQAGYYAQAQTIQLGGEMAAAGHELTASALRQQATLVGEAAQFNRAVNELNFQRQRSAMARQFSRIAGQQVSTQAGTGLSLTSKSFLAVQNETRTVFEQGLLNLKIDHENQRRADIFQTQVKQVQLENQARASEYNAAVERVMAANRANTARFQGDVAQFKAGQQIAKAAPTLLSQLFN